MQTIAVKELLTLTNLTVAYGMIIQNMNSRAFQTLLALSQMFFSYSKRPFPFWFHSPSGKINC